jgi:uncharacterized protein YutE (UPF0331/DUF86 family)
MARDVGSCARLTVGEILLKKALACRDRIRRIRDALPREPADIVRDERTEAFVAFHLFLLIQDAIDIAAHLVAARGLGVPASHRESFDLLARAGLLSASSASDMGALASLRNRIAHSYGDLDPVRLAAEAPRGLDAAATFLDELAGHIAAT